MSAQPSNSGIVTDASSGERHIPESRRADGSTRKAIKIRPGYRPPEDVEVYKNRTAESFRNRGSVIPGAEGLNDNDDDNNNNDDGSNSGKPLSAAAAKNAKRREARKRAKAAGSEDNNNGNANTTATAEEDQKSAVAADPEAEKEKKARNLRKKLKQARELQSKRETGESLLPEQIAKVIKISELVRELEALGLDADDETTKAAGAVKVVAAADETAS